MLTIIARNFYALQERMLGRNTFTVWKQLDRTQWASRNELHALQIQRLHDLLAAASKTPYWRGIMNDRGIDPTRIQSLEDLRQFPLLVKKTIRDNRDQMLWAQEGPRLQLARTSGSTNEALQFYTNSNREAAINAARMRGHTWIGLQKGEKEMYFWGSPIELNKQDRIKQFRDALINDALTNGFELKPEFVPRYFRKWLRWRPRCVFGYPSSLVLMAKFARNQGLDLTQLAARGLRVICTTSEVLTDADRDLVAQAFAVPVYDSYGLREAGFIGHECEHRTMHTTDEQLILETIDPDTLEPTDGRGELVITSLISRTMPVIRYRTGDLVELSSEPCPCGRTLGRVHVSGGRMVDFVVTDQGKWVAGYAFIYICRSVPGILKFQARQERLGEIRILLVTDAEFPSDGADQIAQAAGKRLGGADKILVEIVQDIPPAPSGKYRPVISKVAEQLRNQTSPPDASPQ